jgi:hypothetical protein
MILLKYKFEAIRFIYCSGISSIHETICNELDFKNSSYDFDYMRNDPVKLNVDDEIYKIISIIPL